MEAIAAVRGGVAVAEVAEVAEVAVADEATARAGEGRAVADRGRAASAATSVARQSPAAAGGVAVPAAGARILHLSTHRQ